MLDPYSCSISCQCHWLLLLFLFANLEEALKTILSKSLVFIDEETVGGLRVKWHAWGHSQYQHHPAEKTCWRPIQLASGWCAPILGHRLTRVFPTTLLVLANMFIVSEVYDWKIRFFRSKNTTNHSSLHQQCFRGLRRLIYDSQTLWGWFVIKEANNLQGGCSLLQNLFTW